MLHNAVHVYFKSPNTAIEWDLIKPWIAYNKWVFLQLNRWYQQYDKLYCLHSFLWGMLLNPFNITKYYESSTILNNSFFDFMTVCILYKIIIKEKMKDINYWKDGMNWKFIFRFSVINYIIFKRCRKVFYQLTVFVLFSFTFILY